MLRRRSAPTAKTKAMRWRAVTTATMETDIAIILCCADFFLSHSELFLSPFFGKYIKWLKDIL